MSFFTVKVTLPRTAGVTGWRQRRPTNTGRMAIVWGVAD